MDFAPSPRAHELSELVRTFIETEIEPVEAAYHHEVAELRANGGDPWQPLPLIKELQEKARAQGLWNLFLPAGHEGPYAEKYGTHGGGGLTNLDYAPIAELTGRSFLAPLRVQLQRARHRQHGGAAASTAPGAEGRSGSTRFSTAGSAAPSR